jgi:hypothetical protein
MNDFVLYNPGGSEVVLNRKNWQAYTTQSGYIKLSGRSPQTIARRCSKYDLRHCKPGAITDAVTGEAVFCRYISLIPAHIVLEWMFRDNIEKAIVIGTAGASIYLYELAGLQVKVTLTEKLVNNSDKGEG